MYHQIRMSDETIDKIEKLISTSCDKLAERTAKEGELPTEEAKALAHLINARASIQE